MPSDFTVILDRFVHLGNESGAFGAGDPSLFKGKDFDAPPFSCPNVNPEERAVLFFQSIDVDNTRNVIQINGSNLFGGIPRSSTDSAVSRIWNGNVLLVEAAVLKASGNVLHLGARNNSGGTGGNVDDFGIDNVVIFYKTTSGGIIFGAEE